MTPRSWRCARAVRDAQRWLWNPANKDDAISVLMQNSNIPRDFAERTYLMVIGRRRLMTRDGRITPEMMQTLFTVLQQAGRPAASANLSLYVDMSYLRRAGS